MHKVRKECVIMKKKCVVVLATVMSLALAACSSSTEETKKKRKKSSGKDEKIEKKDDEKDDEKDDDPAEKDSFQAEISFTLEDLDGNTIDESVFASHKLTVINFWEPWCGPCVNEMPELEKLYEDYKDQGLYIIGVFSDTTAMDDVRDVLNNAGTTYPICEYSTAFDAFMTGYVPTTLFVDGNGKIIDVSNGYGEKVFVGSQSYSEWESMIKNYL